MKGRSFFIGNNLRPREPVRRCEKGAAGGLAARGEVWPRIGTRWPHFASIAFRYLTEP